jgi:3-deoxy-manno-octulosonate cytidylyltransferase (CMP-KDO synthetase)
MKTIIIIPSRMASTRFPNKPMAIIDGLPMIQRVWQQAMASNIGKVVVACCEKEVFDLIKSLGGDATMTPPELPSGTDRIFEVIKYHPRGTEFDSIINLQGDMPIINSEDITKVNVPLIQGFDIGTLVTNISSEEEDNTNITKAEITWIKKNYLGEAIDFYKLSKKHVRNIYHHVGIYSFRYESLKKFVSLESSPNELYHKLEQLRALDAKMNIGALFVNNAPLSVDTEDDLIKVENIIKVNK